MSFCLAIRFYVDLFCVNIRELDMALAKFNFVQQEHGVFEDEFNLKDQQRAAISSVIVIEKLWIAKTSVDDYINNLEEIPQEDYDKREKIVKDIQDLQVSYFELSEAIDASYIRRMNLTSRLAKTKMDYEESLKRRNNLIDGWSYFFF